MSGLCAGRGMLAVLLLGAAALVPGGGLGCARTPKGDPAAREGEPLPAAGSTPGDSSIEREGRLENVRQLTFGGENAEAYFSADGRRLIFQSTHGDLRCDQIFIMGADGSGRRMVSTGKGRTTCAYFFPDDSRIVYASTHLGGEECPPPAPPPPPYVWPVYESFDIFSARPDGTDLRRLTSAPGYDAEATFSPDGSRVVFTSLRTGDLEIWDMKPDGSDPRQLTRTPGYDGGAFYSPGGRRICFRASRPEGEELAHYRDLLSRGVVEPGRLEIYIMNADGSDVRQVTRNGKANFCPFFHPSGRKIIYSSNQHSSGRGKPNFDLFLVDIETGEEERVTFDEDFDGFPMFSPGGTKLVWASNRGASRPGETNIFIADWNE